MIIYIRSGIGLVFLGTTAIGNQDKTSLEGYQIGNNEFGGGVSDGVNGIIAYKGKYNELQANKAYFFL